MIPAYSAGTGAGVETGPDELEFVFSVQDVSTSNISTTRHRTLFIIYTLYKIGLHSNHHHNEDGYALREPSRLM
jgi:hypothetical protein